MGATEDCPIGDGTIRGRIERHDQRGAGKPIGLSRCGGRGEQVVLPLPSSQTNWLRVAQYLPPEGMAILKARLAQVTVAYEESHEAGLMRRRHERGSKQETYP